MKQENRPNILIILADQHRADCIGAYGNREIHTPNIDDEKSGTVQAIHVLCV